MNMREIRELINELAAKGGGGQGSGKEPCRDGLGRRRGVQEPLGSGWFGLGFQQLEIAGGPCGKAGCPAFKALTETSTKAVR